MWSLYGRPWADGISISIDSKTFKKWINECEKFYIKEENDYGYKEIDGVNLHISRIAYTNELTRRSSDIIDVRCGGRENHYIDNIFKNDFNYDPSVFAGLIKDTAWSYENEIRIRADYFGMDNPDAIYVDVPDDVIDSMIITSGPLFYGNLEFRIRDAGRTSIKLRQSNFTSLLRDMPCSSISWNINCEEGQALKKAMDIIPDARAISLNELNGRGVLNFGYGGIITIGSGEYEFQLKWKRENKHIYIKGNLGKSDGTTSIPATSTLSAFDFNYEVEYNCCGKVVLICNGFGRVAAVKLDRLNEGSELSFEYRIYDGVKIQFASKKTIEQEKQKEQTICKEISESDEISGIWWDINSKRAYMSIWKEEKYKVIVEWSSGSDINTVWTMSGIWNEEKKEMEYIDEKCETIKAYDSKDYVEIITEYEDGEGKLELKENELFWSKGYQCKFVRET